MLVVHSITLHDINAMTIFTAMRASCSAQRGLLLPLLQKLLLAHILCIIFMAAHVYVLLTHRRECVCVDRVVGLGDGWKSCSQINTIIVFVIMQSEEAGQVKEQSNQATMIAARTLSELGKVIHIIGQCPPLACKPPTGACSACLLASLCHGNCQRDYCFDLLV